MTEVRNEFLPNLNAEADDLHGKWTAPQLLLVDTSKLLRRVGVAMDGARIRSWVEYYPVDEQGFKSGPVLYSAEDTREKLAERPTIRHRELHEVDGEMVPLNQPLRDQNATDLMKLWVDPEQLQITRDGGKTSELVDPATLQRIVGVQDDANETSMFVEYIDVRADGQPVIVHRSPAVHMKRSPAFTEAKAAEFS